MSYDLSSRELEETVCGSRADRVEYLVQRLRQTGSVWTLASGQDLLVLGTDDHDAFVVVFPHPDFAVRWFDDSGIEEADLVAMDLESWLEGTLQELADGNVEVCAMPTDEDDGPYLGALDFKQRLMAVDCPTQ